MRKKFKLGILFTIKLLGGFHFCRFLFRKRLRILCYHGLSIHDEHELDDILFMRPLTFERRMRLVKKWGLSVLPIEEAVANLTSGKSIDLGAVITFDDGWYSTLLALPVLKELGFPSTVYVSTYYVDHRTNVFIVLLRYLYWKSGNDNMPEREGILKRSREVDSEEREKLARETAERLGIDLNEINRKRMFHFMTPDELRTLEQAGMGIELHTHRHRFPYDQAAVTAEVVDNRASLERILPGRYTHLCYPSGRFRDEQFPWLAPLGVRSATTTEKGFNTPRTPIFRLNRLLDREKMTDLEFEAEICGVMELFRSPVR